MLFEVELYVYDNAAFGTTSHNGDNYYGANHVKPLLEQVLF